MVSVNLLPASISSKRRIKRRMRGWATVIVSVCALAAVPLAVDVSKTAGAASMEARLTPVQDRLTRARAELKSLAIECDDLAGEINRADALRGKRSWAGLLTLISAKAPDAVWLTSLSTRSVPQQPRAVSSAPSGVAAKAPESVALQGPNGIHLEGFALDHEGLYEFMSALKEARVFQRVELTSAGKEPVQNGAAVRFVLECYW
jgi:Tfp pilus assembly protein PilN